MAAKLGTGRKLPQLLWDRFPAGDLHRLEAGATTTSGGTAKPSAATPEQVVARDVAYDVRKARGQFFTPPAVADAMVAWACAHDPANFLDPAVGPGIFLERLARRRTRPRVTAFDIDPVMIRLARVRLAHEGGSGDHPGRAGVSPAMHGRNGRTTRPMGLKGEVAPFAAAYHCRDFLTAPIRARYDAIVCNPPYVRHHAARLPESVYGRFDEQFGLRFSRLTNMYALFILRIGALLSARGRAAVITPSEFLNADYGRAVKQAMLGMPGLLGFIVFDYRASIFDGLLTTATITLFDRTARGAGVRFVHASSEADLAQCFAAMGASSDSGRIAATAGVYVIPGDALDPAQKWANWSVSPHRDNARPRGGRSARSDQASPESRAARLPPAAPSSVTRPLGDFARCMRGIATGANDYFTLTDAEVEQWRIPRDLLRPCITKARDAAGPVFTHADFERLRRSGRKCWLLDVNESSAGRVAAYLRHGESLGVHRRYLPSHRRPWYSSEQREPADIWVTVFGRGRLRFVRNATRSRSDGGVRTLTAFHAIYVKAPYRRHVPRLMAYFESDASRSAAAAETRVYGDGLLKFEPRDVVRLSVPDTIFRVLQY